MLRPTRAIAGLAGILAGVIWVEPASATTMVLGWNHGVSGSLLMCDSLSGSCTPWGQPSDPIVGGVAIADIDRDGQPELLALGASGPVLPPKLHVVAAHPGSMVADIPLGNTPRGAVLPSHILGFGVLTTGVAGGPNFAIGTTDFTVELFGSDGTWLSTVQLPTADSAGKDLTPVAFSVTHRDPADNGFVGITGRGNETFAVLAYTGLFPGTPEVVIANRSGGLVRSIAIDRDFRTFAGFAAGDLQAPTAGWFELDNPFDPGAQAANPGAPTRPRRAHPSLTINSAATLVLAAGDYYFTALVINGSATVRAAATTRVFVRDQLTLGSAVRTTSGALAPIVLGFAGTSFSLGVPFTGTLIAPNAALSIGSGSNLAFTGSFFGKTIELQPAVVLTCSAPATPIGLSLVAPRISVAVDAPAAQADNAGGCACTVSDTRGPSGWTATIIVALLLIRRKRRGPLGG